MRYGIFVRKRKLDEGKRAILCMLGRHEPDAAALLRRMEELREILQRGKDSGGLILSTIHSSKGLEYENVYLLDVLNGTLPAKDKGNLQTPEDERQYQEDRRLFYVALTRAKDNLWLFRPIGDKAPFAAEVGNILSGSRNAAPGTPRPAPAELLGRPFADAALGTGKIAAQCEDAVLVEFPGGETELRRLEQPRANVPKKKRPLLKPPGKAGRNSVFPSLAPGKHVLHSIFGAGRLEALNPADNSIRIRFDADGAVKTFDLRFCLDRGLLTVTE